MRAFTCSLAVIGLLLSSGVKAEESKVKKEEVPAAVIEAFAQAYPFAKVTSYQKENHGGTDYYEIECRIGKLKLEMVYSDDGKLFEIEQNIRIKQVPKKVIRAVKKAHRKAKIRKAERLTRGDKTLYEIYVKKGKQKLELVLDPEGNILEPEEDEDEPKEDESLEEKKEAE